MKNISQYLRETQLH